MTPTNFPQAHQMLGRPDGTEDADCAALPVVRAVVTLPSGQQAPCVVSCWQPTPAEIEGAESGRTHLPPRLRRVDAARHRLDAHRGQYRQQLKLNVATPFPHPPRELLDGPPTVAAALDVGAWVSAEIVAPERPLSNYDFATLHEWEARIGWLWATEQLVKLGRRIGGLASLGAPSGDTWQRLRRTEQLVRWFGAVPDFVITLDAHYVSHALQTGRAADVLALVEHEVYHCGVERDHFGVEQFSKDGRPKWGMRPHDVEEFAGVVKRYGVAASVAGPLVEAARYVEEHGPDVAAASIEGICGTCRRAVAVS